MALPTITSGQVLGDRYRLETQIGRGGMGEVWRARDETLQTDVAVKLLLVPSSPEVFEEAKARFDVEQRALVKLRSPYVVRIQDRGLTDDGQPYFVMELLGGRSLQDHLDQRGRMEVQEVLEILEDMGRAIQEPHQKGLAHRDIKPGNIFLIEYTGQRRLEVRLLDFGVAKSIGGEAEEGSVTTAGMMVGTPLFIAPEQINGTPALRSDIYSIGIVAYRCLAGRPPYRGDQVSVLRQHLGAPMPAFPLDVAVPQGLEDLIRRMLEKNPDDRPSAEEMVAEVIQIRAGLYNSVEDSVPPALTGLGAPPVRAAGLVPHTPAGSDPGVSRPESHPVTGTFESGSVRMAVAPSRTLPMVLALLLALVLVGFGAVYFQQLNSSEVTAEPVVVAPETPVVEPPAVPAEAPPSKEPRVPSEEPEIAAAARTPDAGASPVDAGTRLRTRAGTGRKTGNRTGRVRKAPVETEPPPPTPARPVRVVFKMPQGKAQALSLSVDGVAHGGTPTLVSLKAGRRVVVEYLGPDGVRRKKRITVPVSGGVVTLD